MPTLPNTADRIHRNTPAAVNARISRDTARRVAELARHPERIGERLRQLDAEWDTERVLEANAATLALAGLLLGILRDSRFLAVPVVVSAFLLQHALQGWCPPLPAIRRAGVRSAREIETERAALKAMRGDFENLLRLRDEIRRAEASLQPA
jgi:hypothetical protein